MVVVMPCGSGAVLWLTKLRPVISDSISTTTMAERGEETKEHSKSPPWQRAALATYVKASFLP